MTKLDRSSFTTDREKVSLLGAKINGKLETGKLGEVAEFTAIVLTPPSNENTNRQFVHAMIVGDKFNSPMTLAENPHNLLPDVCDLKTAADSGAILELARLYTKFYDASTNSSTPSIVSSVEVGDLVLVALTRDSFGSLVLERGSITDTVLKAAHVESMDISCDSMVDLFDSPPPTLSNEPAANLHDAYKERERISGPNVVSSAVIYERLNSALENPSLAIGILANAIAESALDANVVSGASTESSIGLWQLNVQSGGRIGTPRSSMAAQATEAHLPSSIHIPPSASVIRYFAGGLLAASKGVTVVTPKDYDTSKDVTAIYEAVSSVDNQINYIIESAKSMLAAIPNASSGITAGEWAQWWQIYFEQPASIHDRASIALNAASELGIVV